MSVPHLPYYNEMYDFPVAHDGYLLVEITSADSGPGSGRLAQFIVGRIIVYISVGLVEVDVT